MRSSRGNCSHSREVREVTSAVHLGRPCRPCIFCNRSNLSNYFIPSRGIVVLSYKNSRLLSPHSIYNQTAVYVGSVGMT